MPRVVNYRTNEILPGIPSKGLVEMSADSRAREHDPDANPDPAGAVGAYFEDGEWRWCSEDSALRTHIVFVEE